LAEKVQQVGNRLGLKVEIKAIDNPRKEAEDHYYNPTHSGLLELGLKPHFMTDEVLASMLQQVMRYKDRIDTRKIMPRVKWK
jgi:UDP-sulfoquinovose synthase